MTVGRYPLPRPGRPLCRPAPIYTQADFDRQGRGQDSPGLTFGRSCWGFRFPRPSEAQPEKCQHIPGQKRSVVQPLQLLRTRTAAGVPTCGHGASARRCLPPTHGGMLSLGNTDGKGQALPSPAGFREISPPGHLFIKMHSDGGKVRSRTGGEIEAPLCRRKKNRPCRAASLLL